MPASSTIVNGPALTVSCRAIDESFSQHLTSYYWQWRDLFDLDDMSAAFQHPDFVIEEIARNTTPGLRPQFLVCQRGAQPVCSAVLVPKSIGAGFKLLTSWQLNGYRLAGNRLLGRSGVNAHSALLVGIKEMLVRERADFLLIEDAEENDSLVTLASMRPHGLRIFKPNSFQTRHKIILPDTTERYWQDTFSSKTRNTLRRKVKQFGECQLERVTEPDQVANFLEHAHEISKNSWQTKMLGLRVANDEAEVAIMTRLATLGLLRSYLLWKNDQAVSFVSALSTVESLATKKLLMTNSGRRKVLGRFLCCRCWKTCLSTIDPKSSILVVAMPNTSGSSQTRPQGVAMYGCSGLG